MNRLVGIVLMAIVTESHSENCESVISLSKLSRSTLSDESSVSSHASNFCNEYSRSKGVTNTSSFGASFKFLSLSFGSSSASAEEVASKYCSASSSYATSKDAYKQYIESVAPGAYEAYAQCLDNSKRNVRFHVNEGSILPTEFSMSISFASTSVSINSARITYASSKDVRCWWGEISDKAEKEIVMRTGTTSTVLTCSRDDPSRRSYVIVQRLDEAVTPMTLPWQPYDTVSEQPVASLSALSKAISDVQAQCLGCVEASFLSETDFQLVNGSSWVLCDGRDIRGSRLQSLTSNHANVPDLRGVFLRAKNYGRYPNVDETELGGYREDTVKAHQHKVQVSVSGNGSSQSGIVYSGPSKLAADPLLPGEFVDQGKETQPKNVTVNYFCKIN